MKARFVWVLSSLAFATSPILAQQFPNSPWGARSPAKCAPLKSAAAPTPAQAKQLLRCAKENGSESSGELWLMEDVVVEVGKPQPFRAFYNIFTMADADTTKPVYPIRGSFTWSVCMLRHDAQVGGRDPNQNCRETPVPEGKGVCWRTAFGDMKCSMTGSSGTTRSPTRPRPAS